jgi:hypothetical protein
VEELKQSLNVELEEIQKVSKIVRTDVEAHPPPQNSMNNPLSIHFQPEDGEKRQYSTLIKAEACKLLAISSTQEASYMTH